jgi:hypothetical protein
MNQSAFFGLKNCRSNYITAGVRQKAGIPGFYAGFLPPDNPLLSRQPQQPVAAERTDIECVAVFYSDSNPVYQCFAIIVLYDPALYCFRINFHPRSFSLRAKTASALFIFPSQ